MSDFTKALQRELDRLDQELQPDPRYRRIKQIRELLSDYKTTASTFATVAQAPAAPAPLPAAPAASNTEPRKRLHLSKAGSIKLEIKNLLEQRGPTHRTEILKHLINQQLMGHEKTPMASLAAYLSDWKEIFQSDGQGTFSVRRSTDGTLPWAAVSASQ